MNYILRNMSGYDIITSVLSATIVVGLLGDCMAWFQVSHNWATLLTEYTEWYTRGVGALVVTLNAYLLYRKYRRIKRKERNNHDS